MTIRHFSFENRHLRWRLERFELDDLNLLVGLSGAGKTRTLTALRAVRDAGIGRNTALHDCEWTLGIHTADTTWCWEVETSPGPTGSDADLELDQGRDTDALQEMGEDERVTRLCHERIVRDGEHVLVERTPDSLALEGEPIPVLKPTESVISMLRQDERIKPLYQALLRFLVSRSDIRALQVPIDRPSLERKAARFQDLERLRGDTRLPLITKAWMLQRHHEGTFARMVQDYRDIFEAVEDIRVDWVENLLPETDDWHRYGLPFDLLDIAIREKGVKGWVVSPRMSSGMRRTLVHLLELALSPDGTVILVDEYENSLGVNCLPPLSDHLLRHSRALQFILTSHHPYVINNIAKERWRVVTRVGSTVRIQAASAFPELDTESRQDAFLQLMQAMEHLET